MNQMEYLIDMNAEHNKQLAAKVNKALDQDIPVKFVKFQGVTEMAAEELEKVKMDYGK